LPVFGVHRAQDDDLFMPAGDANCHERRFAEGRRSFIEAGIRDIHAGEMTDQSLILEERLKAALAGFRLIRRVSGVVLPAADDFIHGGGNEVVINAAAHEAGPLGGAHVLPGQLAKMIFEIEFRQRGGQVQGTIQPQFQRNLAEERRDGIHADRGKHLPLLFGSVDDIRHLWPRREDQFSECP
jgi:hypothetical protein